MNKTAISRNLFKVPRILGYSLGVIAYFALCFYMAHLPLIPYIAVTLVASFVSWRFTPYLVDNLIRARFVRWASDMRGIHPDDIDGFLAKTSALDLEKMVAYDLEGGEENEEDWICEFGGPDDEVK